jgi:hypothetical protein
MENENGIPDIGRGSEGKRKSKSRKSLSSVPKLQFSNPALRMNVPRITQFLERMKFNTENALQKRLEVQASVMKAEMENNALKIASLGLLEENNGDQQQAKNSKKGMLLAAFMPMPGSIPTPKFGDLWAQQGILAY